MPSSGKHQYHSIKYTSPRSRNYGIQASSLAQNAHRDQRMTLDPKRSILLSSAPAVIDASDETCTQQAAPQSHYLHHSSHTRHDQPLQSPRYISQAPDISYSPPSQLFHCHQKDLQYLRHTFPLDEDSAAAERRKAFVIGITKPSAKRGFIICRLCHAQIWGPNGLFLHTSLSSFFFFYNQLLIYSILTIVLSFLQVLCIRTGRYHIEKCPVITNARQTAKRSGTILKNINGIPVDDAVFKRPKRAQPKAAKIIGFVMSSSVALADPTFAPSSNQIEAGAKVGRKGYVRCLCCNSEIFAPNARYHASICHHSQHVSR